MGYSVIPLFNKWGAKAVIQCLESRETGSDVTGRHPALREMEASLSYIVQFEVGLQDETNINRKDYIVMWRRWKGTCPLPEVP